MRIIVIDGQGGGFGKAIITGIRKNIGDNPYIMALGTNALATSLMLQAGANEGATGENAIVVNASKADIILGNIAIITVNSMGGELTSPMAAAIADSPAKKVLVPLNHSQIYIMGLVKKPLPHYIDDTIEFIKIFQKE